MRNDLTSETLDAIAKAGFDVYMSPKPQWATYAYFTDGVRVGYIQYDSFEGLSRSTVHIPNRTTGTGFKLDYREDALSQKALEEAFMVAPHWASREDRASVKKWASWEAFVKGTIYGDYVKVREGVSA